MAQNLSWCVLGNILILERILLVISQKHSSIEHNVNVLIVIEYNVTCFPLDEVQVRKHLCEFFATHSAFG